MASEAPRDTSFCGHAIMGEETLIVPDSAEDPRFADNPVVLGDPSIRFYAGAPLHGPDNHRLGTLCIVDLQPRELDAAAQRMLRVLADAAERVLVSAWQQRRYTKALTAETRFAAGLRTTAAGWLMWNYDTRILETNPGLELMLGHSADDLVGTSVLDLFPGTGLIELCELAANGTPQPPQRLRAISREGALVPVSVVVSEVEVSEGRQYVGIVTSLSELVQLEDELAQFFKLSFDLLCIADKVGHFVRLNPAFAEVLGYPIEELLASPILDWVLPEDRDATSVELQSLADGHETHNFENRWRRSDGEVRTLVWSARADPQTELIYAAARDVTAERRQYLELRRLDEQIRASPLLIATLNTELEVIGVNNTWSRLLGISAEAPRALADLYEGQAALHMRTEVIPRVLRTGFWSGEISIVAARGQLRTIHQTVLRQLDTMGRPGISVVAHDVSEYKELDRLKDEFISTVSHELRTPLTSIRGSLGLVAAGAAGPLPLKAANLIDIANQNTERLIRLINDVLDLEKIQSGGVALDLHDERIDRIISESLASVEGLAADNGVSLNYERTSDVPEVGVDRDRLVQVITNLLSNAVKFSESGQAVVVETAVEDRQLTVRVIDGGVGIPPEHLDSIFGRFQQVDSTTSRAKGGTGLGLAISREIVQLHGGSIDVSSKIGEGSTFTVRLPLHGAGCGAQDGQRQNQPRLRPNILIVEDDPAVAAAVVEVMEAAGYDAMSVETIGSAEDRVFSVLPDLVLLEADLPDGPGLDLVRAMESDADLASVPVVMLAKVQTPRPERPTIVAWVDTPVSDRKLLDVVTRILPIHPHPH